MSRLLPFAIFFSFERCKNNKFDEKRFCCQLPDYFSHVFSPSKYNPTRANPKKIIKINLYSLRSDRRLTNPLTVPESSRRSLSKAKRDRFCFAHSFLPFCYCCADALGQVGFLTNRTGLQCVRLWEVADLYHSLSKGLGRWSASVPCYIALILSFRFVLGAGAC